MPQITSLAQVRALMKIPAGLTAGDYLLGLIIEGVEADILSQISCPAITATTYVERIDVEFEDEDDLPLEYRPIVGVHTVVDGGRTRPTDSYYSPSSHGAVRLVNEGDYFTQGRQKVEVTYTAGWAGGSTNPEVQDLVLAATLMVVRDANTGSHAGMLSETIGKYKYEVAGGDITKGFGPADAQIESILSKYRRLMPRGRR